jgi:hypothetical protein
LKAQKGKGAKLLFLNQTAGVAESIHVEVDGLEYSWNASNENWGWDAVTVHEICKTDEVIVKISAGGRSAPTINISKAVLIPVAATD